MGSPRNPSASRRNGVGDAADAGLDARRLAEPVPVDDEADTATAPAEATFVPKASVNSHHGLPPFASWRAQLCVAIAQLCGSFLTVRDHVIYFAHQSAKDFVLEEGSQAGMASKHYYISSLRWKSCRNNCIATCRA
ncbi:hypothetical protein ACQKWADRAFT_299010 [Trichoderma austrokoningii]